MIYLNIFIILLILIYKYDVCQQTRGRDISISLVFFLLIIFAGLRYRVGLDTMQYMQFYDNIPSFSDISFESFIITRHEPLYFIVEVLAKTISPDFFVLQFIQALFINLVIINFFKKNTKYLFTSILLYYLVLFISFNFESMRSSMAIAIFLMSYDCFKEKKWIKYYFFSFFAIMFHTSGIILLILPFLPKIKISNFSFLYLFPAFILALFLGENLELIFNKIAITDNLSNKFNRHLSSSYSGQVLTIKGIISSILMYVLIPYFVVRRLFKIKKKRLEYEFMILLSILFSILAIKVQLFQRLLDFFIPFLLLAFAEYLGAMSYKKTGNKYTKHYAIFFISIFLFLKVYGQYFGNISGIYNYNRYLPYHSIITKEKSQEREKLYYNSYNNY